MNWSTSNIKFVIYLFFKFIIISYTCAARVSDILVLLRHVDCWLCVELLHRKEYSDRFI